MKQTLYEYSFSIRSIHKYIDLVKMAYRDRSANSKRYITRSGYGLYRI